MAKLSAAMIASQATICRSVAPARATRLRGAESVGGGA